MNHEYGKMRNHRLSRGRRPVRGRRGLLTRVCAAMGAASFVMVVGTSAGAHDGPTPTKGHQPFVLYEGQISSVHGQYHYDWNVIIDRRGATPRLASVLGTVPAYYCGATTVYAVDADIDLYHSHREVPVRTGQFAVSGLSSRFTTTYRMTGAISGHVTIPAHGAGRGHGTITGMLIPEDCPTVALKYIVSFKRTYSGFGARGGVPR